MGVPQEMSKCHECVTSRIQMSGLWHENATNLHIFLLFIDFHDVRIKEWKNL